MEFQKRSYWGYMDRGSITTADRPRGLSRHGIRHEYAPEKTLAEAFGMRATRARSSLGRPNPRRAMVKTADARERLGVDEVDGNMRPRRQMKSTRTGSLIKNIT